MLRFLFLQCTCIDVSKRWLALGSSGGGLNLIQKDGWKQRLFLTHKVRVKNTSQKFLGKMGLGKRNNFKSIFIKSQEAFSACWIVPIMWSFAPPFKKGYGCGAVDLMRCERNYFGRQTFVFESLTFNSISKSPEYLRIRRKLSEWNQSNSLVDDYQCLDVQPMNYLDRQRKDRLPGFSGRGHRAGIATSAARCCFLGATAAPPITWMCSRVFKVGNISVLEKQLW